MGISHDTAEFSVQTIRTWWNEMGSLRYPVATSLLIMADGGRSNGYRLRLWKLELQGLADELGFPVSVCHWPRAAASGIRSSIVSSTLLMDESARRTKVRACLDAESRHSLNPKVRCADVFKVEETRIELELVWLGRRRG